MPEIKKKQHYVPQFYLTQYSGKDRINGFDKILKINQPNTAVKNLGHENYYYDLPDEFVQSVQNGTSNLDELVKKHIYPTFEPNNFDKQFLENYFSELESTIAPRFSSLIKKLDAQPHLLQTSFDTIISDDEKEKIADFFALQAIRVPSFRQLGEKVRPLLKKSLPPFLASYIEATDFLDDNQRLFYHLASGILTCLSLHFIENFHWQIAVIETPQESPIPHVAKSHVTAEFLLSDNPVVNIKNIPNNDIRRLSLEFALPLNSRYLLLLREPNFPFGMPTNSVFEAIPNDVRIYNDYQLRFSSRKIFYNQSSSKAKLEKYFKLPSTYTHNADKFAVVTG
ncbi:DUF4238 domain-containing protein [Lysinibacillus sp. FSL H8-0500]|uniref:DUF4238 domain-containing protein n=1 Tax=Lysinibacillus sp. FSL H8-0500 TaxID=2921393 RepID=UPI003100BF84